MRGYLRADRALVVGLGGGATPGAVSQHAGAQVQVVELSSSVVGAAPYFSHVNYDLLHRDNVQIRVDDGRSFLTFTDRRFDVITADIIQPGHAGAGLDTEGPASTYSLAKSSPLVTLINARSFFSVPRLGNTV